MHSDLEKILYKFASPTKSHHDRSLTTIAIGPPPSPVVDTVASMVSNWSIRRKWSLISLLVSTTTMGRKDVKWNNYLTMWSFGSYRFLTRELGCRQVLTRDATWILCQLWRGLCRCMSHPVLLFKVKYASTKFLSIVKPLENLIPCVDTNIVGLKGAKSANNIQVLQYSKQTQIISNHIHFTPFSLFKKISIPFLKINYHFTVPL